MNHKEIRAVYGEDWIRVYQAYPEVIAEEAVQNGTFGPHFGMERMTWIKPSFLWMMYRCGWAEKENQEHVLAIDIKRSAFDYILDHAVLSSYQESMGMTQEEWKDAVKRSDIRCQWDPERDIYGKPLEYRSVQLGLRGRAVQDYVHKWILRMEDITDHVKELKEKRNAGVDILPLLPREQPYIPGYYDKLRAGHSPLVYGKRYGERRTEL